MYIQSEIGGGDTMNKTRPNRIYFRVTDKELEKINQCVNASGKTRQDWLLSVVTPFFNGGDTIKKEVAPSTFDNKAETKICPECGAPMEIKNGYRGKFWGCTRFPQCRYTEDWTGE